jgi:hypothetical protein
MQWIRNLSKPSIVARSAGRVIALFSSKRGRRTALQNLMVIEFICDHSYNRVDLFKQMARFVIDAEKEKPDHVVFPKEWFGNNDIFQTEKGYMYKLISGIEEVSKVEDMQRHAFFDNDAF